MTVSGAGTHEEAGRFQGDLLARVAEMPRLIWRRLPGTRAGWRIWAEYPDGTGEWR